MLNKQQILSISNNILAHLQNLEDAEDAQEFTKLYLLSLADITEEEKKNIIEEVNVLDKRINVDIEMGEC